MPAQVHVIDIARKSVRSFPIPRTPYGRVFSRDDKHLYVGSWEEKSIVRVNLEAGKVDQKVVATGNVDDLVLTPSGDNLLVYFTVRKATVRHLESRRTSDLKPIFQTPVSKLYPEKDVIGEGMQTRDGKLWIAGIYGPDKKQRGYRLFAVPGILDRAGASKDELAIAAGIVTAKTYAHGHGIDIPEQEEDLGDPSRAFAAVIVEPKGDIYVSGTEGEGTRPVAFRLSPKGKLVWKRALGGDPKVKEYVGARLARLGGGRTVVHVFDYYYPGGYPASRVIGLDAKGRVAWEHRLGGTGGLGTPLPDRWEVVDGQVVMTGRIFRKKGVEESWRKVLGADGTVVSESIDPAPAR